MSDDRKINVELAPRTRPRGAATALNAAERKPAVADAAVTDKPAEKPEQKRTVSKRTKNASAPKRQPTVGKVQIAADVPADTRGRARAAYRFAQFYDRVPTFSEFVANALEAEINRIEQLYNNGDRLEPETENLPAGRPSTR